MPTRFRPARRSAWTRDPFGGEVEGNRLYGRGSGDAKSGLAVMIACAQALKDAGVRLKGDLTLLSTVEEEEGGGGGMLACVLARLEGRRRRVHAHETGRTRRRGHRLGRRREFPDHRAGTGRAQGLGAPFRERHRESRIYPRRAQGTGRAKRRGGSRTAGGKAFRDKRTRAPNGEPRGDHDPRRCVHRPASGRMYSGGRCGGGPARKPR